jgi:hypothetical protein
LFDGPLTQEPKVMHERFGRGSSNLEGVGGDKKAIN